MTQAGTQQSAAPPTDPVRAALDDPEVSERLLQHALARLGGLLADRPATVRVEIAAEAVQDAVQRALERAAEFDPTKGCVAGWLHGYLNLVLHERCRSFRKQPIQPAADPGAWDGLAVRMSGPERTAELAELLARLSDDQRRIVTRHHLDELSHEQIAAELGISVPASRVRLARAMCVLRELAGREGAR